jgi:acetyl-CoA C-acetyltransferase
MVCFPYPKYMNAVMEVDQGAALLLTRESVARELGIAQDRWVYLWGCADVHDLWFVGDRANYYESPAIRIAGRRALSMAGVDVDDVAYFDLYSCFPAAVQYGRDALGIAPDDPRPLSVTGGLPYFGGPANNYVMHAIAAMTERLRSASGKLGLVSGLGWYSTKHAIGVYGRERPSKDWQRTDPAVDQAEVDAMSHPEIAEVADGGATIETYTVAYDRAGEPDQGIVVGRLDGGQRCFAHTGEDRALAAAMTTREFVGERVTVRHDAATGTNVATV